MKTKFTLILILIFILFSSCYDKDLKTFEVISEIEEGNDYIQSNEVKFISNYRNFWKPNNYKGFYASKVVEIEFDKTVNYEKIIENETILKFQIKPKISFWTKYWQWMFVLALFIVYIIILYFYFTENKDAKFRRVLVLFTFPIFLLIIFAVIPNPFRGIFEFILGFFS